MKPEDFPTLDATLDWTLRELSRAALDRKSAFRWPVLVTCDEAQPQGRIVVLRSFSRKRRKALIYTDQRTPKVAQVQRNPLASLVFFDSRRTIQIRANGSAQIISSGIEHANVWQKMSEGAKRDYTSVLSPGNAQSAPDSSPTNMADQPSHFTMIELSVTTIDWLMISRQGHRRALFDWDGDKASQTWVTP
ncbi:MAG: pyridoxamine 5'-phosphate oxidase family protein [Burkholderiaceae bacterium]